MGARFLATPEAAAHPAHKQAVLKASEADTAYTALFGRDWPAAEAGGDAIGETDFAGQRVPVQRLMVFPPHAATTTGGIDSMALYPGRSAGLCSRLVPAAEFVARCIEQARDMIRRLSIY
jgi:hypothetical protein